MRDYNAKVTVIDTGHLTAPDAGNNLYASRKNIYDRILSGASEVSVCVLAYNRLDKTRQCVESILRYTKDIDYELILVDNGSEKEIYTYFESVPFEKKRIIRITKNLGAQYATNIAMRSFEGKYFALVTNDSVVTKNWLHNLLVCFASDPTIGMVTPGASNVSNLQEIPLAFSSLEEMQLKAAAFNRSDPKKWEQRVRLVAILFVIKREVIDLIGIDDAGFFHDFEEDDLSVRIRRAGYKLMLCMDTFIHHDHDFRHGENKTPEEFQMSLEHGRKNFSEKYYGLDSWSDMSNYEGYVNELFPAKIAAGVPHILGIDVMCGMPVLQIKNLLCQNGKASKTSAFTTNAKYYADLQTVCDTVACDRIERLPDFLENQQFHYVILGQPVNTYADFPRLLRQILAALKPSGVLFLKLRNCFDIFSYLSILGQSFPLEEFSTAVTIEQMNSILQILNVTSCNLSNESHQIDKAAANKIRRTLEENKLIRNIDTAWGRIMTRDYVYCIVK